MPRKPYDVRTLRYCAKCLAGKARAYARFAGGNDSDWPLMHARARELGHQASLFRALANNEVAAAKRKAKRR